MKKFAFGVAMPLLLFSIAIAFGSLLWAADISNSPPEKKKVGELPGGQSDKCKKCDKTKCCPCGAACKCAEDREACQCCDDCKCGDISGIYHVRGEERGKPYNGACVVTQHGSSVMVFAYSMEGGSQSVGIGIRKGKHIAVSWKSNGGAAGSTGVTIYEMKGRDMHGSWSPIPADGEKRTERLRWMRAVADGEARQNDGGGDTGKADELPRGYCVFMPRRQASFSKPSNQSKIWYRVVEGKNSSQYLFTPDAQDNSKLTITGECWLGDAKMLADGSMCVLWKNKTADFFQWIGLYRFSENGSFNGHFGSISLAVLSDGKLHGQVFPDSYRRGERKATADDAPAERDSGLCVYIEENKACELAGIGEARKWLAISQQIAGTFAGLSLLCVTSIIGFRPLS